MSALRIGQRVKLVRPIFPEEPCPPIGAEGVIKDRSWNLRNGDGWIVDFPKHPTHGACFVWLFASEELEPILDEGDFARFLEEVLKPVPVTEDEPLVMA